jgi:hypothetical protein
VLQGEIPLPGTDVSHLNPDAGVSSALKGEIPLPVDVGLSPHKLWNMKRFYKIYANAPKKTATLHRSFTVKTLFLHNT